MADRHRLRGSLPTMLKNVCANVFLPDRNPRPSVDDRFRQWHRAHRHDNAALVAGSKGRVALHYARQAAAECLHRELQGRLRDELLNETLFSSLAHAREALSLWKDDYNTVRPRSGLGNLTPALTPIAAPPTRDGTPRCAGGSAPRPVASPSQMASNQSGTLLIAGCRAEKRLCKRFSPPFSLAACLLAAVTASQSCAAIA
jgi:hypothetical protein